MRLYGLFGGGEGGGGGKYVSVCKACGKVGGLGACSPGKFLFWTSSIRRNLVESGTTFAQT